MAIMKRNNDFDEDVKIREVIHKQLPAEELEAAHYQIDPLRRDFRRSYS